MMRLIIPEDQWVPVGVDSLEPNAVSVVRSRTNRLVVAGPGAGKTELLAQRANFLLVTGQCPVPKRILAISFKRDAAANLKKRVGERCGELADRFDSWTLDAFAKNLVDRFRVAIPEGWRPLPSYNVRTERISTDSARDWMLEAHTPDGHQRPPITAWSREQVDRIFSRVMHGVKLPYDEPVTNEILRHWGLCWWREQLLAPLESPRITFPMLNRLAAYLLRCNPKVARGLRMAYTHLFLDEFQDTTEPQWDLVTSAFSGSAVTVTAVGDDRQRIMTWAGAMPDAFSRFQTTFAAERVSLMSNYRSTPDLVRIQHHIALSMEGEAIEAVAARRPDENGVCQIWEFDDPNEEAEYIADLVDREIGAGGAQVRDYCILVRQRVADMIVPLEYALSQRGLALRDESELQDLQVEPLTHVVLAAIRLAICRRDPEAWAGLCAEITYLAGLDRELNDSELESLAIDHRDVVEECLDTGFADIPERVIDVLGARVYRGGYPQYGTGDYLYETAKRLGEALQISFQNARSLPATVDHFLGQDIIPAMTVHKSKGLEFDTVIFMGLEDDQWWNFRHQPDEEKRAFFVAFSRAIRRVVFTFSGQRETRFGWRPQRRRNINDLYSILIDAGVEVVRPGRGVA